MKFSKLYSCGLVLFGGYMLGNNTDVPQPTPTAPIPTAKELNIDTIPTLNIHTDTVVVYPDTKIDAAGVFLSPTSELIVKHFVPGTIVSKNIVKFCDEQQKAERVVRRHEFEHAKKALITRTRKNLNTYQAAQLTILNETMAPASEIIEAMTYRFETGKRFPADRRFIHRADSLIMVEHCKQNIATAMFDFENPVIADIILESAIDKFIYDYNRGIYHTSVRRALNGNRLPEYRGHDHCEMPDWTNYNPSTNQWGALFTYDIAPFTDCTKVHPLAFGTPGTLIQNYRRVDIWNHATEGARQRTLAKVHDCIMQEMTPGQMLLTKTFKKIH